MATSTSGDWTPGDRSPSLLPGVTSHGDVTEVTPGDKGVTYIQVRVID